MILAVTGATGFVGGHLVDAALAAGHRVRALARRPQQERPGVEWVSGGLDDAAALDRLVDGADATIHVAGVVNVPTRAAFHAGNVDGTAAVLAAVDRTGPRRFVHVSSLAARESALSDYGWSKAEAETLVAASGLGWTIVRPPAVYGPRDQDMLPLFRAAWRGVVPMPPAGRMSALAAPALADLLLALAAAPGDRAIYEPEDAGGPMIHSAFARALGTAVGRRVLPLPLPAALLRLAARADRAWRGDAARLTPDRVAYMTHSDWAADPAAAPPRALWTASGSTADGLAATVSWYRANGLL